MNLHSVIFPKLDARQYNETRTIPMTKRFRRFLRRYLKGKQPGDFALKPEVTHGKGTYRYDFHRHFNDW